MKIPAAKSKPSKATPYGRPRRAATDLPPVRSRTMGRLKTRPRLEPLDFAGVRKGATAELSTTTSDKDCGFSTPPGLRRASTLTLAEDEPSADTLKAPKDPHSMSRKSSSVAKDGTLTTSLRKLGSGSIVGNTSLTSSADPGVSADKQSVSEKVLSTVSSLLKKMSMPRRVSSLSRDAELPKTSSVDENNLSTALEELKVSTSKKSSHEAAALGKPSEENDTLSSVSRETSKSSMRRKKSSTRSTHSDGCAEKPSSESNDIEMDDPSEPNIHAALLPPAGLVEVAISFDMTGSMYDCLDEVRAKIQDLVQRLQADIPGIRFAVIAHGDYCDAAKYVIKWVDFGASLPELCEFVEGVEDTYGGDGPECYELVLLRAREALSWTPGSRRVLIVINDDVPHKPGYKFKGTINHIDWREECAKLRDMGVTVYGVQAGDDKGSARFNAEMARITGGKHVTLQEFSSIFDFIMMICYREGNPDMLPVYEQEVRARGSGGMARDVEDLATTFRKDGPSPPESRTPAATPSKPPSKSPKRGPPLKGLKKSVKTIKTIKHDDKAAAKCDRKGKTKPKSAKAENKDRVPKKSPRKRELKGDKVLKREKLPDSYFNKGKLKNFKWTRWTRAIVPELPNTKQKSKFVKCSNYPGYRLKTIFNGDSRTPAIYEFAVQGPGSADRKKAVVYFWKSVGYKTVRFWDLYHFRHKTIQQEVARAVNQGCSICIRRGVLKARPRKGSKEKRVKETGVHIKTTIDYAWKKYLWRKTNGRLFHRSVASGSIVFSHGDL